MQLINLKKLRKEKQITQEQLAKQLSITRSAYNHYELGTYEPDLSTLKKLANYFEVSLDYLCNNKIKNQLQLGFLNNEQKEAIKILVKLNQKNFSYVFGIMNGLYATQN